MQHTELHGGIAGFELFTQHWDLLDKYIYVPSGTPASTWEELQMKTHSQHLVITLLHLHELNSSRLGSFLLPSVAWKLSP